MTPAMWTVAQSAEIEPMPMSSTAPTTSWRSRRRRLPGSSVAVAVAEAPMTFDAGGGPAAGGETGADAGAGADEGGADEGGVDEGGEDEGGGGVPGDVMAFQAAGLKGRTGSMDCSWAVLPRLARSL